MMIEDVVEEWFNGSLFLEVISRPEPGIGIVVFRPEGSYIQDESSDITG
jgi:hypothetical protein